MTIKQREHEYERSVTNDMCIWYVTGGLFGLLLLQSLLFASILVNFREVRNVLRSFLRLLWWLGCLCTRNRWGRLQSLGLENGKLEEQVRLKSANNTQTNVSAVKRSYVEMLSVSWLAILPALWHFYIPQQWWSKRFKSKPECKDSKNSGQSTSQNEEQVANTEKPNRSKILLSVMS